TQDRIKISGFTHPDVLLAGIARHVGEAVLLKDIINETGTIHAAVRWIGRTIGVTQILFCQREPGVQDLPYFCRISFVSGYLVRRKAHVRPALFSLSRRFCRSRGWTFFGLGCWGRSCSFAL